MSGLLMRGRDLLQEAATRFGLRVDKTPIDSVEALCAFTSSRSAYVAQKKLYGYLKERMGTRFPVMFSDDAFVGSINIAKMHVFAACLSDLCVHVAARTSAAARLDPELCSALARHCFDAGIAENADKAPDETCLPAWTHAFEERVRGVHWANAAVSRAAFRESPAALIEWAPIAPELKQRDKEIVQNSIRFAWNEIIEEFGRRARPEAIVADWRSAS